MDKTRILNLVKKDFEIFLPIIPKILLITYALSFFIPMVAIFISIATSLFFIISLFLGDETQNEILLSLTLGVKRCEYVMARYISLFILLLLSIPASIYGIFALNHKVATIFTAFSILLAFLIIGISVPLYFKFKKKSVTISFFPSLFCIFLIGLVLILINLENPSSFLFTTEPRALFILVTIISLITLIVSTFISIKIFDKRDFS